MEEVKKGFRLQLIPYFISSHPGCTQSDMNRLAGEFKRKIWVEQVQDFAPTPMTKSSVMYYTGLVPETGKKSLLDATYKKSPPEESFFLKITRTLLINSSIAGVLLRTNGHRWRSILRGYGQNGLIECAGQWSFPCV